ncbi:hypothetical protein E4T56_gene12840 [Termitomyces sp. T112]|nr:hypothetical protein C0989_003900 [Termitomyces sp. Mn162]KAG5735358.1 hypothetical protein E4T56_gene12840 [Termitomyces sp. T112]
MCLQVLKLDYIIRLAQPDFYELLSVARNASPSEIKIAYRRTLLRYHPDKNNHNVSKITQSDSVVSISLIKDAYNTLSDPEIRKRYDADAHRRSVTMAPRPAQVVSLEEFEEAMTESEKDSVWRYQCRCGGMYRITAADMENGHHLVGCSSCSEVVWVGYELQESDNEG